MFVLVRLVMIASLAAYTLPTVSVAMHGDMSSTYDLTYAMTDAADSSASVDVAESGSHDHGNMDKSADKDTKQIKQDCCSDFCLSMAIISDGHILDSIQPTSVRASYDDQSAFGELSSLHRPPSIRT
jgi:hypothetical protein